MGWQQGEDGGAGFGDVQPRYVFQVPLEDRSLEEVHKGFNQLWRRNIKKAEKAGVEVVQGGYDELAEWQRLYEITAERDHFRPRPLSYFQRMWTALNAEDPNRMRLYFARHEGENLAAATMLVVGGHVWYSYGASANTDARSGPPTRCSGGCSRTPTRSAPRSTTCAASATRWTRTTTSSA